MRLENRKLLDSRKNGEMNVKLRVTISIALFSTSNDCFSKKFYIFALDTILKVQ